MERRPNLSYQTYAGMSRYIWTCCFLLWVNFSLGQTKPLYAISPPNMTVDSIFFYDSATVEMEMALDGSRIRYALDGSEVTETHKLYTAPLVISETTMIRARCFHDLLKPSTEKEVYLHKLPKEDLVRAAALTPKPAPAYSGIGKGALSDHMKGAIAFRSTPDQWLGWEGDSVTISLDILDNVHQGRLVCSFLEDMGSWILGPAKMTLRHNDQVIATWQRREEVNGEKAQFLFPAIMLTEDLIGGRYELILYATNLPADHPGSGHPAWLFIDEIFLLKAK